MAIFVASKKTYGVKRIKIMLEQKHLIVLSERKIWNYMHQLGIKSQIREKKKMGRPKEAKDTKNLQHNFVNQQWNKFTKNQLWVTDVTYIPYGKSKFAYLSVIKDVYTGLIVGYDISKNHNSELIKNTLQSSQKYRNKKQICILHSDNGVIYNSHWYYNYLLKNNMIISKSRPGNSLDNAACETFFSQIKNEWLRFKNLQNFEVTKYWVIKYLDFYNNHRISLKWKKPPIAVFNQL